MSTCQFQENLPLHKLERAPFSQARTLSEHHTTARKKNFGSSRHPLVTNPKVPCVPKRGSGMTLQSMPEAYPPLLLFHLVHPSTVHYCVIVVCIFTLVGAYLYAVTFFVRTQYATPPKCWRTGFPRPQIRKHNLFTGPSLPSSPKGLLHLHLQVPCPLRIARPLYKGRWPG